MKVTGLDGRTHHIGPHSHNPKEYPSSPHLRCLDLLAVLFPADIILEEVNIPGSRLSADFILPAQSLLVEVHGEQHYEKNSLFHDHITDFWLQRGCDMRKKKFCEINHLIYLELPHHESNEQWSARIISGLTD